MSNGEGHPTLTLDDVRQRFVEAEENLERSRQELSRLGNASRTLGDATQGLREAGQEVAKIGGGFEHSLKALEDNAEALRDATNAIEKSKPAKLFDRIEALATQIERLNRSVDTASARNQQMLETVSSQIARARMQTWLGVAIVAVVVVATAIVLAGMST